MIEDRSRSKMKRTKSLIICLGGTMACWSMGCSGEPQADSGPDAGDAGSDADLTDGGGDADQDSTHNGGGDADQDAELPANCLDHDGDGYGVNCELGLDCDDNDPAVWTTCGDRDSCARRHAGCPCDEEGAVADCRTEGPLDTVDGHDLCYLGTRVCHGGVWGPCQEMTPYPFDHSADSGGSGGSGSGVHREAILGYPEFCEGTSCDRSCNFVHDCLSGPDLQEGRSRNLTYNLSARPPSVVLADLSSPGVFQRPVQSYCANGERVEWYAVQPDLHVEEPGQVVIRVRTAANQAGLASAGWVEAARCPGGDCPDLGYPTDREFGEGSLLRALGPEAAHLVWLEIEVTLSAGGGDRSPNYVGHRLYFFCDPID